MLDRAYALGGSCEDGIVQGYLQFSSGALATWQADVRRGVPFLLEGLETFRRTGHVNGEIHLLFFTGMCLGFAQEFGRAAELHRQCIALAEPRQELFMRSYSNWALGMDALMALDIRRATALEHESLRVKWAVKDHLGIALVFEALSWIAAAENRGERAATLLGAADSIWQVIGMSLTRIPYISAQRETGESLARGKLSEKAFEHAFRAGAAMRTAEAISFALEEVIEARPGAVKDASPLTRREEEVAVLIGEGLSNRDIAGRLVISQRTAQGHVENILRKLGFTSRTQVAAWVAERNAADGGKRRLRAVGGGA
jgi:DNA-binding CsgD family transcriptional regulator